MKFSHKLKISNGNTIELYFSKGVTVYGVRYLIDVKDEGKTIFTFKMKKVTKQWIIIGSSDIPEWLWQLESKLSDIIDQPR